jgi:hypothetical protein
MPSTYSSSLKIELIATGEQESVWGTTTNTNLGTALEQAIVGRAVVTFPSDADYTLTLTTSNAAQDARAVYLVVQGTISASRNLIVPTIFKNYVVKNNTTGSQDIVVKTSAGTGVTIPNGKTAAVYVDGTNVIKEFDYVDGLALNSPTMTGTPTAPTAALSTNTTQIATTAFVLANQTPLATILQTVYPVGSIYINATNSTNPATLLGFGTWTAFGAGRVPVGFNASDPLFDTAEETGGSKDAVVVSHTHTATSTVTDPGHVHTNPNQDVWHEQGQGSPAVQTLSLQGAAGTRSYSTASATTGITVSTTNASTGSSGTNANLQPYITVYMWKRTA